MESVRERMTKIAEIFEKKPIEHRYSFDVLCEFIHDKSVRLQKKFADLQAERKSQDEERIQYYKNKVVSLDAEKKFSQSYLTFANEVLYEVVPRLASIVSDRAHSVENINVDLGRRILG